MSKILEKLADQHEERIINVLYKLEEDVVRQKLVVLTAIPSSSGGPWASIMDPVILTTLK